MALQGVLEAEGLQARSSAIWLASERGAQPGLVSSNTRLRKSARGDRVGQNPGKLFLQRETGLGHHFTQRQFCKRQVVVVEVPILARQITNIRAQRDDAPTGT